MRDETKINQMKKTDETGSLGTRLGPGVHGAGGGLGTRFFRFVAAQCEVGGGTKKTIGGGTKKKLKARLPTAPLGLEIDIDIDYFFSQSGQDFSLK